MFPAPIGGTILSSELAACIVVIVLYGLLVPVLAYRIWDRRSRTTLLFGTCVAVIDRIVYFTLRTIAARRAGLEISNGLLKYGQVSFGLGFVGIGGDLVSLLRCAMINPTYGYGDAGRWDESPASHTKDAEFEPPEEGEPGQPELRGRMRVYLLWLGLSYLASSVPGMVCLAWYERKNWEDEVRGDKLFNMRYASTAVGLFLVFLTMATALWSRKHLARVCHKAIHISLVLCVLSGIVAAYRLSVMHYRTPSPEFTGPGSLSSPGAKAAFYVLHILPEWLSVAILLCFNVRKIFGTGLAGDWRGVDETAKQIATRREREAKRVAKKAAAVARAGGLEKGGVVALAA